VPLPGSLLWISYPVRVNAHNDSVSLFRSIQAAPRKRYCRAPMFGVRLFPSSSTAHPRWVLIVQRVQPLGFDDRRNRG
jgi:hypothetical protein